MNTSQRSIKGTNMDRLNRSPLAGHTANILGIAILGLSLTALVPAARGNTPATSALITKISYDAGNNVASVTDPRGLITTQATDGLGQRWQQVSPDTGTTTFAYDTYGRLASMTRANGVTTTYGYDGLNRKTSVSAGGLIQHFFYDQCTNGLGRLCGDQDLNSSTGFSYTPEGWMASKSFLVVPAGARIKPSQWMSYALGYSYDFAGRIVAVTYPDGNSVTYARTLGAVSSVSYILGATTGARVIGASSITYQPMDMGMTSWTASNGLVNTLSYDTDSRLTGIKVPAEQNLGFAYDAANRLTQITNGIDGTLSQTYGYDFASRLTSTVSGAENESYTYDADGNRLNATANGALQTYTYATTSNQLTSDELTSNQHAIGKYGYDALGNITTINGSTTYSFTPFNRLSSSAGSTNYIDPEGQRLSKFGGSTGINYFAPDLESNAMMAESQYNYQPPGLWTDYVWLNGRLIGRIANGQVYAVHADQVGRPEVVTDASQAVVWHAQNFPFTRTVNISNISLNLGFPGQYFDAETQLWNNGYRDYVDLFGRYLESDPLGLAGGANTYLYVQNSPLNNIDSFGLTNFVAQESVVVGAGNIGGSASAGIYITLQWAPNFIDIGVYAGAGPSVQGGATASSQQLGIIKGNESNIQGVASNAEVDAPGLGGTVNFDDHGKVAGILGGTSEGAGVSSNEQNTVAFGLNDFGSWIGGLLYNHIHPYNPNCH